MLSDVSTRTWTFLSSELSKEDFENKEGWTGPRAMVKLLPQKCKPFLIGFAGKMKLRTFVDTLPLRYLAVAGGVAAAYLLLMIIIAVSVPPAHTRWEELSFTCKGKDDYSYDPAFCTGTDMSTPNAVQTIDIPPDTDSTGLVPYNYQLSLTAWPYNSQYKVIPDPLRLSLLTNVVLYGIEGQKEYLIINFTTQQTVLCPRRSPDCYGFVLWVERGIDFSHYRTSVTFLDSDDTNKAIQNVRWVVSTETKSFNSMRVGYRLAYFFIAVILLILWILPLRSIPFMNWPMEHRAILILLIALAMFNNPFFGFQFLSDSWFFPFMDSLYQTSLVCILLIFWFSILDYIRFNELREPLTTSLYVKYAVILVYGVLSVVLNSWIDIRFEVQPALGTDSLTGIIALYYITSCLFGGLVIWLVILSVLTIPAAYSKPHLEVRFLYLTFPAIIVCMSMMIGVFAGSFSPYNRSVISFLYYFGLFNVYVYLLVFGFFPNVKDFNFVPIADEVPQQEEHIQIRGERGDNYGLSAESAASALNSL